METTEPARPCCEFTRLGRRLGFPVIALAAASALLVLCARLGRPTAAGAASATAPAPATADAPAPVSGDAVAAAIERAKSYLAHHAGKENWEPPAGPSTQPRPGDQGTAARVLPPGALTALVLNASAAPWGWQMAPDSYECAAASNWLRPLRTDDPAVLAMRLRVRWYMDRDENVKPLEAQAIEHREINRLIDLAIASGPSAGLYSRGGLPQTMPAGGRHAASPPPPDLDVSLTVAWAMETRFSGGRVPEEFWERMDAGLRKAQRPDGSWSQRSEDPPAARLALTANATATLLFARRELPGGLRAGCEGGPADAVLDAAMAWLDRHAAEAGDDPAALYAVQRVVTAGGRSSFGGGDWYDRGAARLLARQNGDGSWPAAGRTIPDTAWAILFLAEGRFPVGMAKLMDDPPAAAATPATAPARGSANQRPGDVANLVEWAGPQFCTRLQWRQVRLRGTPEAPLDLSGLDAPVLYVSGGGPLALTPEEEAQLRRYALRGGLILGNADCASRAFADAFAALGTRLFPAYSFRELPDEHPVYRASFSAGRWRSRPKVLGLSNGVRELMLLVPEADLGKAWQARSRGLRRPEFELGDNILCYADRQAVCRAGRGPPRWPAPDPKVQLVRPIKLARLLYPGNADPEPAGWDRLAVLMRNQFRTDLNVSTVTLGTGRLNRGGFQVAHLTGTGKLSLPDADRAEILSFVNAGGTLIVDAAGGSEVFGDSAAAELAKMFPQAVTQSTGGGADTRPAAVEANDVGTLLPAAHPVYQAVRGTSISQFPRRRWAARMTGRLPSSRVPGIRGITVGGRTAVFFSPEDLSAGLAGADTDGILGYEPDTAAAVMRNLLLYATARP